MQKISLEALARQQLKHAADAGGARAAETVVGGHEKMLRQTVVGLIAGAKIAERDNHDESTIYVLKGRVVLRTEEAHWEAPATSLLIVPEVRHSLEALEDSALLITVAKRP